MPHDHPLRIEQAEDLACGGYLILDANEPGALDVPIRCYHPGGRGLPGMVTWSRANHGKHDAESNWLHGVPDAE